MPIMFRIVTLTKCGKLCCFSKLNPHLQNDDGSAATARGILYPKHGQSSKSPGSF